jgi:hypothetical protein
MDIKCGFKSEIGRTLTKNRSCQKNTHMLKKIFSRKLKEGFKLSASEKSISYETETWLRLKSKHWQDGINKNWLVEP